MSAITTFPSRALQNLLSAGEFGHVIDGQVEASLAGATQTVIDPSTGEPIVDVPLASPDDVDRAVSAARRALLGWRRTVPAARASALLRFADVVDQNAELLAELDALNVGKPLAGSVEEMAPVSDTLRFMAGAIRTAQGPMADEYLEGYLSMIRREPIGVVAAISAWNFPLMTAIWKIAPALAAGNTMVLKPSELTPLSTALLGDLARAVLPPGVLNVVIGTGPDAGRALAEHPDVDMISLTGSVNSGVEVTRSGAASVKRIHLELGGKAPVVVFDDADIQAVADTVAATAFVCAGQECGAATRVLCSESALDALTASLSGAASSVQVGPPDSGAVNHIGPLISAAHRERVSGIVSRALDEGAVAAIGGGPVDGAGFFFEPTVLTGVAEDASINGVEIFGPVVTVETFSTEEEAIRRANASTYGLSASVWTQDTRRALRMTDALDYGTVWVNTHLVSATEMPWSGFGQSGLGREQSLYAIDEFSRTKHVMIAK